MEVSQQRQRRRDAYKTQVPLSDQHRNFFSGKKLKNVQKRASNFAGCFVYEPSRAIQIRRTTA
jgi:hypothetical protein